MQIAILGRQPGISLAELESLFGATNVMPISDYAALVDSKHSLPQPRLGGTIKSACLLTKLEGTNLEGAFTHLQPLLLNLQSNVPEGKLQLGVSIYGFKAQRNWLLRQMLELKKAIKKTGRSVRIIENKSEALEAAQVLYNKLTGELGIELLLVKQGKDVLVAQTTGVQDIDAYAKRDHGRPMRDAFVGMLPPKLAQIILNLAIGTRDPQAEEVHVMDPFCGTGVVLQEALLMGCHVMGGDLDPLMVEYTKKNMQWLHENVEYRGTVLNLDVADASSHHWVNPFDTIACETYLGKPFAQPPDDQTLEPVATEVNDLIERFLQNIARHPNVKTAQQYGREFRMCIAVPAWHTKTGIHHLKVLEKLSDLGYNRLEFTHASTNELVYHRDDQVVGRELVVLVRK